MHSANSAERLPSLASNTLCKKPEARQYYVSHSVVSVSLRPHGLSMEFSRQEYWSGLAFSSPGDLPDPGIEPRSPVLQADSLPSAAAAAAKSL